MRSFFFITLYILFLSGLSLGNQKCHQSDAIQLHYLPEPFRVTGKATGILQSEQVSIGLTVETLDKEAAESLNRNSQIINNAITAFKTLGLSDNEFSTNGLSVYPSYRSEYNKDTQQYHSVFEGYKVRNSITINTKQINLAGKIIDNAVQNGVTNIDYIEYNPLSHNITKLREKLLAEAVRNARKQAKIVLDELQYEIVSIKNIQIVDYHQYQPPFHPQPRPMPSPQPDSYAETKVFSSVNKQEVQVEVFFIIKKLEQDDD
ncbi:outer membrane protein (macronuclear) [Tetrahymena thermophila SB210]|uniref:Outer membrane protein n=1 Tax=Tetrahymena thermophila (strain SB210) TaxID=312017 RepID=Q22BJ6_TETTS|nr:outer membrane protein [Tetrahymena thermophila SB210]EAR82670.1 outer membrane protein [Tetrahymena thermophila SB210]|eukprot:XP_001030333.1 outer membrane protein [Tetrahymena thermophila SB210]